MSGRDGDGLEGPVEEAGSELEEVVEQLDNELEVSIEELDSDPHLDLADRYEQMLERQVNNLWNIDTKAWRAARLIGILFGILLTGASVASNSSNINVASQVGTIPGAAIAIGLLSLLVSLFLSLVGILNVRAGFGPNTSTSKALQNGDIEQSDYPNVVSVALAKSVRMNNRVMEGKADYLRYTFASLYVGLLLLATGAVLTLLELTTVQEGLVLVVSLAACYVAQDYIVNQRYDQLAEEEDDENEEDEEG